MVIGVEENISKLVQHHEKILHEPIDLSIPEVVNQTYVNERNFGKDTLMHAWQRFPASQQKLFRHEYGDWEGLINVEVHLAMISPLIHH